MPNTPRNQGNWQKLQNNMKAWMPKRQNYPNQNAYRAEVLRRLEKFTGNNNYNRLGVALSALPMGNRVWLYEYRNNRRNPNTTRAVNAARRLLNPRETNILLWGKERGGQYRYGHKNYANMLRAVKNYPRLVSTAKKLQDPKFLTQALLSQLEGTPSKDPAFIAQNLPAFRNTVRGNVSNAAKKLLEIREKAAKRTIARYVKAGKVGWHISHLRKLREMNKARGKKHQ